MESMFRVFEYWEVPFSSALGAMELAGKTFPKYLRVYRFRGNEVIKLNIVATNSKVQLAKDVTCELPSRQIVKVLWFVHVQEGR